MKREALRLKPVHILIKLCEYLGIDHKGNKNKQDLEKLLEDFDEESFFTDKHKVNIIQTHKVETDFVDLFCIGKKTCTLDVVEVINTFQKLGELDLYDKKEQFKLIKSTDEDLVWLISDCNRLYTFNIETKEFEWIMDADEGLFELEHHMKVDNKIYATWIRAEIFDLETNKMSVIPEITNKFDISSYEVPVYDSELGICKKFYLRPPDLANLFFIEDDFIFILDFYSQIIYQGKFKEIESFSSIVKKPQFSDVEIILNGMKKFYSHKFILSKFTNLDMSKEKIYIDMNGNIFMKFIEYAYTGCTELNKKEIDEISKQFGLEIQNFVQFQKIYSKIYDDQEYTDFIIKSENGKEIKCHKILLGFQSEYLKSIVEEKSEIELKRIPYDALSAIIKIFYTKKIETQSAEEVIDLFKYSRILKNSSMKTLFISTLFSLLNLKNVFAIHKFAIEENISSLKKKTIELLKKKYSLKEICELFLSFSDDLFSFRLFEKLEEKHDDFKTDIEIDEEPKSKKRKM
eukprot:gene3312-5753_t